MDGELDKIIVYSLPRTGSTVVWQIIHLLTGIKPDKSHGILEDTNGKIVITIRDPKYSITSECRIGIDVDSAINNALSWSKIYQDFKDKENVCVIRYEDYIDDNEGRIKKLIGFLNLEPTADEILYILDQTSINKNLEIAESLGDFSKWDADSFIHGSHINNPDNSHIINFNDEQLDRIKIIAQRFGY